MLKHFSESLSFVASDRALDASGLARFGTKPKCALKQFHAKCYEHQKRPFAEEKSFTFRNWVNTRAKPLCLTVALSALSACGDLQIPDLASRHDLRLTPVQTCAIGYDLAAQIYKRVVLSKTTIIPGARPSACEAHTLTYLRLAGFKIDETAPGPAMTVDLNTGSDGSVAAIATVGGSLRLARSYRLASTGVYPQGAVSFITLPDGTRTRRPRAVVFATSRGDR